MDFPPQQVFLCSLSVPWCCSATCFPVLQSVSCCCGEGELVGGVHTLFWRSVQVYHELQELEEEDKGREEVQEIERESQVEENHSHGHDHGDDMKGLNT